MLSWRWERLSLVVRSKVYAWTIAVLRLWRFDHLKAQYDRQESGKKRVAYYIWHFPTLCQSFVNQEIAALKRSGIDVKVYSNDWEDEELLDENTRSLMSITHYIQKWDMEFLKDCRRHFFRKDRLLYIKLFLYVVASNSQSG